MTTSPQSQKTAEKMAETVAQSCFEAHGPLCISPESCPSCIRLKKRLKQIILTELNLAQLIQERDEAHQCLKTGMENTLSIIQERDQLRQQNAELIEVAKAILEVGPCFTQVDSENGPDFDITQSLAGKNLRTAIDKKPDTGK